MTTDEIEAGWKTYYEKFAKRPSAPLLTDTLARFETATNAIDLGCGVGIETRTMLTHGWHVLAIDAQKIAIDWLEAAVPPDHLPQLETTVGTFETVELPPTTLIWACLSLPFCPPDHFDALWAKICGAIRPGGRFAGHFFGTNHAWSNSKRMTFHTHEQLLAMCEPFEIEAFNETEDERPTANRGIQHWHQFSVVLRKM